MTATPNILECGASDLVTLLTSDGTRKADVAREAGVNRAALSRVLGGHTSEVTWRKLARLAARRGLVKT